MTVWINALYESQGQAIIENPEAPAAETQLSLDTEAGAEAARIVGTIGSEGLAGPGATTQDENVAMRSEERRVGKECRGRRAEEHERHKAVQMVQHDE